MSSTTTTRLYYLQRSAQYPHEKPYIINWPVAGTGVDQTNLLYEGIDDIEIKDIRGLENDFEIDSHSFQLVNHETSLTNDDFESDRIVRNKYYPEMIKLAQDTLGASRVFVFEHTHRLHKPNINGCGCDRKSQPLVSAHIDHTAASSLQRVRYHMKEEAKGLLENRFQVVNIWRPLFGPLRDFPLTLCDSRTVRLDRDGEPTDLVFPHYVGESLNLYHHPDHRWHYVSDQRRDEVWMFKCFDSAPDVATAAPHCAFDIQKKKYTERPRESIEVRLLVFYDN